MEAWFSRMLGFQEGLLGSATEWRLEFSVPGLLVASFVAVLAVGILWIYRRESGSPPRWLKGGLVTLRCVSIALVLALLFEPILATEKLEDKRPTVVFLLDDSMSMGIKGSEYASPEKRLAAMQVLADVPALASQGVTSDLENALRGASRYALGRKILDSRTLGWAEKLGKTHRLRFFTVNGAQAVGETGAPGTAGGAPAFPDEPQGRATRLGDALREIVQGARGQHVAGIVVLSDGQSNAGEDPVSVARFAGSRKPDPIPFFCVGLGSDEPHRDVEVVSVVAPPDVLKSDQPFQIKGTVRSKGMAGSRVVLALYKGEERVDEKPIILNDALGGQVEQFEQVPSDVGIYPYSLRVEGAPEGDLISENNSAIQTVRITDQKFKILYVEGWPRFEYHRLEALLDRNDHIYDYTVFLLSADGKWAQPASSPEHRLPGFPANYQDLLDKFDLIIFGDVDPQDPHMPSNFAENVRKFVMEGGGAFIMAAGMFHSPNSYAGTPMEQILPIRKLSGDQSPQTWRDPFLVKLNPQLDHPLMQLSDDPDVNTRLWNEKFRPHWHWHLEDPKPLARALLLHSTHQTAEAKPCALMTLMQAGRGQSLFIGMDETWRWARGVPEGDALHPFNKFWNQAIKYLAADKLLRGGKSMILKLDRSGYTLGERVIVTLELLDMAVPGFGPELSEIPVSLLSPDRIAKVLTLRREPGTANFVGTFPIVQKGHHELKIVPRGSSEPLAEVTFDAKEYTAEFAAPQMNRTALSEAAAASGGEFIELDRLAAVPDLLKSRTKQVTRRVTSRLMDAPLVFIIFCAAIVTEWVVRKRFRMM